jgi:hypothetical protein
VISSGVLFKQRLIAGGTMTVKTAAQLKAEMQQTDPQDQMNNLVDTMQAGLLKSYAYIGTIATYTTSLGAAFLAETGRAHKVGDMAACYVTADAKYYLFLATGTGASNWVEVLGWA